MGQINARDWTFEVETAVADTFAEVAGLESFTLSNSEGEESADTTTFASGGFAESQAMQRGASLSLEGKLVRNGATKDPGQARADALAELVGEASLGTLRFRHASDTEWTVWTAWVSKGDNGGGTNEKTTWSATFTRSGAATTDTVA